MLTNKMFLTKEHYNPNTYNLYDGQNNIPLYKKSIFHQKNFELSAIFEQNLNFRP